MWERNEYTPLYLQFYEFLKKRDPFHSRKCAYPARRQRDRARKSYAIVLTGETARFANVIIKKGVVTDPV